jgi:hypothetical protein
MRNFVHRLTGVAQILSVSRERPRDRKTSALGLTERERDGVVESAVSEMSTGSNVISRPNCVRVKRKQPLSPVPITADGALVLVFVCSEENSVMRSVGLRRIDPIERCEDDIADAN